MAAPPDSSPPPARGSNSHSPVNEPLRVCVITARDKEASAVRDVFDRLGAVKFEKPELRQRFSFQRGFGNGLEVTLAFAQKQGDVFTLEAMHDLVDAFSFSLVFMTGICAGRRDSVDLGDVIVASKGFYYETSGKLDAKGLHSAPEMFSANPAFLNWVKATMDSKSAWSANVVKLPSPFQSISYRKKWLLRAFFEFDSPSSASSRWLTEQGFDTSGQVHMKEQPPVKQYIGGSYGAIVGNLLHEKKLAFACDGTKLVLSEVALKEIRTDLMLLGAYPTAPCQPVNPTIHYAPCGTGPAVRADDNGTGDSNAFDICLKIDRDTLGVEMEIAAFYQVLQRRNLHGLAVKAVSDHGDSHKDDSYHEAGKQLSAAVVLIIALEAQSSDMRRGPLSDIIYRVPKVDPTRLAGHMSKEEAQAIYAKDRKLFENFDLEEYYRTHENRFLDSWQAIITYLQAAENRTWTSANTTEVEQRMKNLRQRFVEKYATLANRILDPSPRPSPK